MKRTPFAVIAVASFFGCTAENDESVAVAPIANQTTAEGLIGRWCYRPTPAIFTGIYTLARGDDGNVTLIEAYSDGSEDSKPVTAIGPNKYLDESSEFGDGVEILHGGELQLFNSEHPFSMASRLPDEPTKGECR
jgi:hypothetical protein